jgi:hypothetical protein
VTSVSLPGDNPFALFDQLLQSGVISEQEHKEQCHCLAHDLARQIRRQSCREDATAHLHRFAPSQPISLQEPQMNPQDLLKTMELNQKIMSEQLKALNGQAPNGPLPHQSRMDSTDNAAELINHLTNGHLNNAALNVQALAGVAARVRTEWRSENRSQSSGTVYADDGVIDVQAVETKTSADPTDVITRTE